MPLFVLYIPKHLALIFKSEQPSNSNDRFRSILSLPGTWINQTASKSPHMFCSSIPHRLNIHCPPFRDDIPGICKLVSLAFLFGPSERKRTNDAWNPAKYRQADIDEEVCVATSFEKYSQWWQEECQEVEADIGLDAVPVSTEQNTLEWSNLRQREPFVFHRATHQLVKHAGLQYDWAGTAFLSNPFSSQHTMSPQTGEKLCPQHVLASQNRNVKHSNLPLN